jgi:dTDP-4-dehydrorhamnose 3,5-epimerase-like enzyme
VNLPYVTDLVRHVDDRGDLAEIWRESWEMLPAGMKVRQVYTVNDPSAGTIRAYHRHKELWDIFSIVKGSAKFHVVRGPDVFPLPKKTIPVGLRKPGCDDLVVTLSDRKPQTLVIPPLWWHGWMSLEPGTMLLSIASHEYNSDKPDEERESWDSFGKWRVEHK